jgi:hypothetical protein
MKPKNDLNQNIFYKTPAEMDAAREEKMLDLLVSINTYRLWSFGPHWEFDPVTYVQTQPSPNKTPVKCWHDGELFHTKPVGMPISRIRRQGKPLVFRVVGSFCSFGCMKAYNFYEFSKRHDINYLRRLDFINIMFLETKKLMGNNLDERGERFLRTDAKSNHFLCPIAPPRQLYLSGRMTLEEFRSHVEPIQYEQLMPPCIGVQLHVEEYKNRLLEYKKQRVREKQFELPDEIPSKQSRKRKQVEPVIEDSGVPEPEDKTFNIIQDLRLSKKKTIDTKKKRVK